MLTLQGYEKGAHMQEQKVTIRSTFVSARTHYSTFFSVAVCVGSSLTTASLPSVHQQC
jgi:hypothetical protein